MIIDEAHRMKSTVAATRRAIKAIDWNWLLLLTGAPVRLQLPVVVHQPEAACCHVVSKISTPQANSTGPAAGVSWSAPAFRLLLAAHVHSCR